MKIYVFSLLAVFCSCSGQNNTRNDNIMVYDTVNADSNKISQAVQKTNVDLDSIKQKILVSKEKLKLSFSDTIKYQFSLEDVGTEGNEGTAYYLNDSVRKIELGIGTSMWMIDLLYLFDNRNIKVIECTYNIADVYSGGNSKLVKRYSYIMDFDGLPLEKVDSSRVDVFQELKQAVPFTLK